MRAQCATTDNRIAGSAYERAPGERRSKKLPTLYDVARLAGVSTATVSRVVHGHDRVAASTRARVLGVIEDLGYVPDGAAQSLSRRRKEVIGLVSVQRKSAQFDIENMSLLFWDEILHGVEGRLAEEGWSLLITFLPNDDERTFERLVSLCGKVDGLLVGEGIVPSAMLARLAKRVPLVVVAGAPDERVVDVVTADNRGGAAALVTHLVKEHRYERIFHVDGPPGAPDARERRVALEAVIKANRSARIVGSFQGIFSAQSGHEAAEQILQDHGDDLPDAVVCANDQMAIGVLQAFAKVGVRVPTQVAVVGFDDIYPGSLYDPPITTVHQPMRMLGDRACARLLERVADPTLPPRVEVLPTELALRSSCGCSTGHARRSVVAPIAKKSRSRTAVAVVKKPPVRRAAGAAS